MAGLKLLRGRVAVREIVDERFGSLWLPQTHADTTRKEDKQLGMLAQSSHRGRVLDVGMPSIRYGHEVPHGFITGDEVVYVYAAGGTEQSRRGRWTDDGPCVWIAQEEVIAVVEP